MVLVDTSVWIDHLRRGNETLASLLEESSVACHPFVIGELACGRLKNRAEILHMLELLPRVMQAGHDEVREFVEVNRLAGTGVGWIDVCLLSSAVLDHSALWTLDRKLARIATWLGVPAS